MFPRLSHPHHQVHFLTNAHTHAHKQEDLMFELCLFSPLSSLLYASQRRQCVTTHFQKKNNKIKINWLTRGAYRDFIELLLGKKMCLAQEIIQSMTLLAKAAEQDRAFKKNWTRVLNPLQLLSFIHTTNTATVNYSHSISIPLP